MYERLAAFLPRKIVDKFKEKLEYADIDIEEEKFVGVLLVYAIALSIVIALIIYHFFQIPMVSFLGIFILLIAVVYLWLTMLAENKAKFVERVLPDALQLIASNVKSGITAERALFISARPEFGPLSIELKRVSKLILSGERMEIALLEIPKKIHSTILERTIWLVSRGITAGGQIADLLMQLSDDLRQQNSMQEEIKANISMYILLIFFAAAIGAPVLFGITTFIVQILTSQMSDLPGVEGVESSAASSQMGMASGFMGGSEGGMISPEFIMLFTMILLLATSFFASLTMGVINTGRELSGLKQFPLVLIISFGLFFGIRLVLTTMFGNLIA